ncbi:response regulator transcription factor [Mucilaginibacter myungsuensis]|uniref:Response regulator transcription factor n=1 Tax=Mucilaginibacter myungsuensis TaxID=649104 RepID=A0A929KWT8_9SPHI|nr:response regulator transcription factor [Mucilaginibacter myungsuensis]MBE9661903.1 response regulator transcription factor [Mucilaginibacter myungsuensis]MDN3599663.1 response regulator transcription factor [Mucilaginibacter myungsuensis]
MAESTGNIGIAIVDDQHLFRQSLALLITTVDGLDLITDAANGQELADRLPDIHQQINVALVDLDMPVMNGVQLNKLLQKDYPNINVIILSVHTEERIIAQMMEEGASACLAKNCDKDELVLAIETVHKTGYYMNPAVLNALKYASQNKNISFKPKDHSQLLTPREQQVLELICQELTNPEIAEKLFISVRTVEGHRTKLLEKTGCQTTAGLVIFAIKNKLIEV